MNTITPDLFSWIQPEPRQKIAEVSTTTKVRRFCPIIVGRLPLGGTGDIETLVVDGTKTEAIAWAVE
jgi:hypothetical protein